MTDTMSQEEFKGMSPAEQQEYLQRQVRERKWCHRAFRSHMISFPVPAPPSVQNPQGGMAIKAEVHPADQLCKRADCMMWDPHGDNNNGCCIDRSAAVAVAYGKQTVVVVQPKG